MERRNASYSPILGITYSDFGKGEWIKCAPHSWSSVGQKKAHLLTQLLHVMIVMPTMPWVRSKYTDLPIWVVYSLWKPSCPHI